ncbi:MAG: sensor histidine kinase [Dehalococcoidia bacterium]
MKFQPSFVASTLSVGVAVIVLFGAITVGLAILLLSPPASDVVRLAVFLAASGGASLAVALAFLRLYRGSLFRGIRGKLFLAVLLSAGLVLANVGFTAYLMFLSSHDLQLTALLLLFSFGIAMFFAVTTANIFQARLAILLNGIERMGSGEFSEPIALASGDELDEIAAAFNAMATRLAAAAAAQREGEEARRELIAAVSHDLRTPLATMRAMIESINDGIVTDAATITRYHRTMQAEVVYIGQLIDDLFELSQLDSGVLRLAPETCSISDLISDTVEALRPQAESRNLILLGDVADPLPNVTIDMQRMQRVLYNLVQNAIRHTPEDGSVLIRATANEREIRISVEDTGEGIEPHELTRVFERFFRGDRSRSREDAGSGLGLTIAKGIVELHGGTIWATSERDRGATFTFALPT